MLRRWERSRADSPSPSFPPSPPRMALTQASPPLTWSFSPASLGLSPSVTGYAPMIHMLRSEPPVPQNGTVFGDKLSKEVIKVK